MDVLFKDAQSVQFAGLLIATDFKTIENKINSYAISDLHYNKIKISDAIYVVNVNGYIGNSTGKEIEYAKKLGKEVMYLEPIK